MRNRSLFDHQHQALGDDELLMAAAVLLEEEMYSEYEHAAHDESLPAPDLLAMEAMVNDLKKTRTGLEKAYPRRQKVIWHGRMRKVAIWTVIGAILLGIAFYPVHVLCDNILSSRIQSR